MGPGEDMKILKSATFTFDFCFYFLFLILKFYLFIFIILKLIYFIKNKNIMNFYKLFIEDILIILIIIYIKEKNKIIKNIFKI